MPLRLQVLHGQGPSVRLNRYEFDGDRAQILLGRRGGVDVLLPHPDVALVHARIDRRGGSYYLVDQGAEPPTILNGARQVPGRPVLLAERDRIAIAQFILEVSVVSTEIDGLSEGSSLLARRMVRAVFESLGEKRGHPHLRVLDGRERGELLSLPDFGRTYILGFSESGTPCLDAVDMWREHAALLRDESGVTVRLLDSATRLEVAGRRVQGARMLSDGEMVEFGGARLRFVDPAELYVHRLQESGASTRPSPRGRRACASLLLVALGASAALLSVIGLVWILRL